MDTIVLVIQTVLIVLKAFGLISWSWWWVLAPAPIYYALVLFCVQLIISYDRAKHG